MTKSRRTWTGTWSARGGRLALVLALLAGLLGLEVAAAPVASATPGQILGPYAGKPYASVQGKAGLNGNVVVYASYLLNFDPKPDPPRPDLGIYYRDRSSGTSGTVVKGLGGTLPNSSSFPLAVSEDTTTSRVLYRSTASNLVAGDSLGHADVFLANRVTAASERVSIANNESEANGPSTFAAMSAVTDATGPRFVAFNSAATNLVSGDTNGKADIFVRDRVAGTTERVSLTDAEAQANGDSGHVSISEDGRYVAFTSVATNLVPGDTNSSPDVFVRDRIAGTTTRVSIGHLGQASGPSGMPGLSADGRFVVFESDADDIVPVDDNVATDVFVHDRTSGSTERVSVGPRGEEGWGDSLNPSISRDGRFIAFETDAAEFSELDTNWAFDIYVRDRLARDTRRATEKGNGEEAFFGESTTASISPDGRFVAFDIDTEELSCGETCDSNDDYDVYMKDMTAPFVTNPVVGASFKAVAPTRILDTLFGPVPSGWAVGTKLSGGGTIDVQVAGGGTPVPTNAAAVVLNLTSSAETTAGALVTAYPTGVSPPSTVALHPQPGVSVSNQIVVGVGTAGKVSLYTDIGATHLRVDVVGYFAPDAGGSFTAITVPPAVVTRGGPSLRPEGWPQNQKLAAGTTFDSFEVQAAGSLGVPADAQAVAVAVTALEATTAGSSISVFASGAPDPGTQNVLPQLGPAVTSTAVVPVGESGRVTVSIQGGAAHVIVAITGWFGPKGAGLLFPVTPKRVVDTRSTKASLVIPGRTGPLAPIEIAGVPYHGRGGVPTDARAVVMTTSSAGAAVDSGALIMWQGNAFPVAVSSLNQRVASNATNTVWMGLSPTGVTGVVNYANTSVHLFNDLYGYFR